MTVRSGDRVPTGVEQSRRALTEEEAKGGGLPDPFTPREWRAMRRATQQYAEALGIPDVIRVPRRP